MSGAAIGIICKAPQPGRSKTRLAAAIGVAAASELSACFLRDVAATIETVPEALGRRGYGVYAPAGAEHIMRQLLPAEFGLLLQAGDDLGHVLIGAARALLLAGHDCVLLVNGDSPTLPPRLLAQAIEALREPGDRMVLGPASDGGYYLIGLKYPHQHLFARIAWGTETVARTTCERAAEIGLATTLLPEWYDVDDIQTLRWLQDELFGHATRFRGGGFAAASRAFLKDAPQVKPLGPMPRAGANQFGRLARFANSVPPLHVLAGIGAVLVALTLVTPFAFEAAGDNAFIALAVLSGLLTIAATNLAERIPPDRALWLVLGLGIFLRAYVLLFDPLLSSDVYRYVWDGRVQASGINPYRYVPAHEALAFLRDWAIFPHINRADTAVTIYPPVAQFFFLIVTRIGESVTTMRLALLGCEAATVTLIMLLLRRMNRPVTRVTAYLWHPLPVWEIANGGHVDALMVALLLLGLWIALTGHALRGAVLITFAALVKPVAAPVLAAIWRPWDLKMPLVVIAAAALCYLPYLSVGWGVFGFLTKGYLTEEGISAGNDLWLLSLWRLVFGEHQGDVVAYVVLAALVLLFKGLSVARSSHHTIASSLADINMLLLMALLLLSPNYPWYFLVITPFVALCGSQATWVVSIGALLLSEQLDWDFYIPRMVTKSILFGGLLLAWALAAWRTRMQRTADAELSP